MLIFLSVAVFIFGLCVGSFLNCLIYRLETGKSFFRGRSFCPKCKHKLGVWDLIPIASFVLLKGKCRYCRRKISWQYPAIEIATGLLLIFNFYFLIFNQFLFFNFYCLMTAIYLLFVTCFLIIIFVYDLKHYIIPDKIVYPAIGVVLLYRVLQGFKFQVSGFKMALISGVVAAAFFFLIWFVSRGRWLGFGDVKLSFFMGLFLGFPNILVALFSAFSIGASVGIVLILLGKKKLKSEVPFGPFLITGTFLALFWGERLISWYLHFF